MKQFLVALAFFAALVVSVSVSPAPAEHVSVEGPTSLEHFPYNSPGK
jgi:hypothetical protein